MEKTRSLGQNVIRRLANARFIKRRSGSISSGSETCSIQERIKTWSLRPLILTLMRSRSWLVMHNRGGSATTRRPNHQFWNPLSFLHGTLGHPTREWALNLLVKSIFKCVKESQKGWDKIPQILNCRDQITMKVVVFPRGHRKRSWLPSKRRMKISSLRAKKHWWLIMVHRSEA